MFLTKVNRPPLLRIFQRPIQVSQYSDDGNHSSDDEKKKTPKAKPTEKSQQDLSAADKLNRLLASMNAEGPLTHTAVKIPQAGGRKQKLAKKKVEQSMVEVEKKSESIEQAAKDVADLMGDKTKKTESELLSKLLNHVDGGTSLAAKADANGQSLSDLIVSMKIDRTKKDQSTLPRGDYVRKVLGNRRVEFQQSEPSQRYEQYPNRKEERKRRFREDRPRMTEPPTEGDGFDLFGQRLGIFTNPEELKESPDMLKTWAYLKKRELKILTTFPPRNHFQKMSQWAEQGIIWKFPINNEQGMDEEAKVDFTEHVFLEQHLEGWCPNRGPIRHFMELVCVGLSKNPYITAAEKKEHILWYRDYFEAKKELLAQVIIDQKETEKVGSGTKALEK